MITPTLVDDELDELKKYIIDFDKALLSNYDCVEYIVDNWQDCVKTVWTGGKPEKCLIADPSVPTSDDLDLDNALEYPKCFVNFSPGCWRHYHWLRVFDKMRRRILISARMILELFSE